MAERPYFRHGIEELRALATSRRSDIKALKAIQYELQFRHRPKGRALKSEVDELVSRLSTEGVQPAERQTPHRETLEHPESKANPVPERVVVECASCRTPNFVSRLEGVVQHLSCSSCRATFEAQFKYGVMRTTFHAPAKPPAGSSWGIWGLAGVVLLIVLVLLLK